MRTKKIVRWQNRSLVAYNAETHRIVLATFPKDGNEHVVNRDATDEVYEAILNELLQNNPKRGVRVFTVDGDNWFSLTAESVDADAVRMVKEMGKKNI